MDTEYFDDSWNVKVEQFRRFLRTLFRETIRKCRSKRRGYTRFLTDDEKRFRKIIIERVSRRRVYVIFVYFKVWVSRIRTKLRKLYLRFVGI